jgi:hypothetical protein
VADGIGMLRRNNEFRIAPLKKQAILPLTLHLMDAINQPNADDARTLPARIRINLLTDRAAARFGQIRHELGFGRMLQNSMGRAGNAHPAHFHHNIITRPAARSTRR